jgi:hypothetical protein
MNRTTSIALSTANFKSGEKMRCGQKCWSAACRRFQIELGKNQNAADFTDFAESKTLSDDVFELERPDREFLIKAVKSAAICCDFPGSDSHFQLHSKRCAVPKAMGAE